MADYTWPSIYFAYSYFVLMVLGALVFLIRTVKDGYWGARGEDVKYQVFDSHEEREEGRTS
ncbi:MAG: hypothetical protein IPM24_11230 [Bryobacterales bacterium]|nr:hypothetical protein [Bryobacterales bacterium]